MSTQVDCRLGQANGWGHISPSPFRPLRPVGFHAVSRGERRYQFRPRPHRQGGQALIEFAFVVMVMALLALGVVDFGLAIQQGMLVQEAATAAALYGSLDNYNAGQPSLSQYAGTVAGVGATGLSTTVTTYCVCSLGGAVIFCSTTSCSGDRPQMYVQATATSSFASLFPYRYLPSSFNLSSTVVIQAQ